MLELVRAMRNLTTRESAVGQLGHSAMSARCPVCPNAGGAIYEYTPLAWQVISKDADVYGLAEALWLNCCF